MVMGMGNISGPGFDVVDYFRQRNCESLSKSPQIKEAA